MFQMLHTHIRAIEMIDTDRNACTLGTIEVAHIAVIYEVRTLCGLEIGELDVLVTRHLVPVDTTLIMRHVDALLLAYNMADGRTEFPDARQWTVNWRCWRQNIGYRQSSIDSFTQPVPGFFALLVGKS